ncbi:HAD-IA family hydrolase [Baaleninema sp.]|uniref:HAD-IA family hydrolase n=1 Tax=Baaleninema sp. TaxID=3101197 RepID=UPI003D078A6F
MASQSIPLSMETAIPTADLDRTSIESVIFDFDGTIADTLETIVEIINELAESFGYPEASPEAVEHYKTLSSRQILKQSGISYFQLPWVIFKAQRLLSDRIDRLQPIEDIESSLVELKLAGFQLGILTSNSKKNVRKFLNANGLEPYFDFVYSGLTLFGKERLFRKTIRRENLDRDRIVYIGDETRDIESAKNVGIKSIAVSWGFNSREALSKFDPDFAVDSPKELLDAIRTL